MHFGRTDGQLSGGYAEIRHKDKQKSKITDVKEYSRFIQGHVIIRLRLYETWI